MLRVLLLALVMSAVLIDVVHASAMFDAYCAKYGCRYADLQEERQLRQHYFDANMRDAARMGSTNPLATFGATRLADRSPAELARLCGRTGDLPVSASKLRDALASRATLFDAKAHRGDQALPSTVDWRSKGVVTPVKNQGDCGSCWAFAAIANIESMSAIAGYPLTVLSEQSLVSCDDFFSFGCNGGASVAADLYLTYYRNGSVPQEANYPYVSGDGSNVACNTTALNSAAGAKTTGSVVLTPLDVASMELFVATQGPLTVAVDATGWSGYQGGILTTGESSWTDHQVVIVGYGADNVTGTPYWTVKNSWGTDWGEAGYIRLKRGVNLCNIELVPTSATVEPRV